VGVVWGLAALATTFGFMNQLRIPPLLVWVYAVIAVPLFGYLGYRNFRSARALQAGETTYPPFIGPPARANCIIMGCGSLMLLAMGISFVIEQRPWYLSAIMMLMAVFIGLLSVCGFLWSQEARRAG
jgi:hypothetical protein